MHRYTLLLRYDDKVFYLAPRFSISVLEPDDFETVNFGDVACCGNSSSASRTFKFKLYFDGSCSLASAWALYNALVAFLNVACTSDLVLERKVQDETSLVYKVDKVEPHMVDASSQYSGTRRVLVIEITFTLSAWPPAGVGLVSIGA